MVNVKTKRLELKPITDAVKEDLISIFTNHIVKQTFILPDLKTEEEKDNMFNRMKNYSLSDDRYVAGVYLGNKMIGILNEVETVGESMEVGYAFHPDYYNQGYATEALSGAIEDLFKHGYKEILAGAFVENPASIRVMEKCGMKKIDKTDEIEYRGKKHKCIYYMIENDN